ncbi:MAG: type toxin-antitoxin system VapC family toxin [Segetibacter sp.]|nr:type toxin-antitoxin system VapC family toxin [Segetibacter sp.]
MMAKSSGIIVDTGIITNIFRGDKEKRELLKPIREELGISVITAMELMNGAKNKMREFEVSKTVRAYNLYNLTSNSGTKAFAIISKYHLKHLISIDDALIAATAIGNMLPLCTDNLNDYSFITELGLFKPE